MQVMHSGGIVTVGSHGSKELPWAAALETAEEKCLSVWTLEL